MKDNQTKPEPLIKLYDTKQAGEILSVKPQTLNRWRHEGTGPVFIKLGSLVRYRYEDLLSWIENQLHQNTCYK